MYDLHFFILCPDCIYPSQFWGSGDPEALPLILLCHCLYSFIIQEWHYSWLIYEVVQLFTNINSLVPALWGRGGGFLWEHGPKSGSKEGDFQYYSVWEEMFISHIVNIGLKTLNFTPNKVKNMKTNDILRKGGFSWSGGWSRGYLWRKNVWEKAATSVNSCDECLPLWTQHKSGSPRLQLLEFLLDPPELASTPVDTGLEAGYICS